MPSIAIASRPQNTLRRLSALVARSADLVMSDLLPNLCLGCETRLPSGRNSGALCQVCERRLRANYQLSEQQVRSLSCEVSAALSYHGVIRDWMLAYKFAGQQAVARAMVALSAEALLTKLHHTVQSNEALLVPMPCNHLRFVERGFHHTALLARLMLRAWEGGANLRLDTTCLAESPSQHHASRMNRRDREQYARQRFYAPNARTVAGRKIILLDDIVTTGATMQSAKAALLQAGANQVVCLALCAKLK